MAHLKDGTLRSWGAKSLEESGRHGEPFLTGDGYARIGEGSGSTNMLTGSGVDEAWTTGTQLGEAVLELLRAGKPFTQRKSRRHLRNPPPRKLGRARRARSRKRPQRLPRRNRPRHDRHGPGRPHRRPALAQSATSLRPTSRFAPSRQIQRGLKLKHAAALAVADGRPLHDALLSARGWPEIPFDGRLLVTHQDALLMGGKVQAMPGFADHVVFRDLSFCAACEEKTCIAMCSGQAITWAPTALPAFEREKCVHCGACLWNCAQSPDGEHSNIEFRAGAGGLHSAEN